MDDLTISPFEDADRDDALAFWSSIDGVGLNESDTPAALSMFLARNPGCSFVARDRAARMVAAVLCGHDGRRGALHHLAVAAPRRGSGLGRRLVDCCFEQLANAGIARCNIYVYRDNPEGSAFWLRDGWIEPSTWVTLQKPVRPMPA